jgi:hypothetical protein
MKDSLEEFVNQSKDGFDSKVPPTGAWKKIESELPVRSVSLWNSVALWRAAAILLFGLSLALLFYKQDSKSNKMAGAQLQGEMVDLEVYYGNQINEKKQLVSQFQFETGLSEDEVTQNLQKLEAMYQVLKEEMKKRPSKDVKDALVLNLLIRVDLLNQQLNKLDRREEHKPIPISS